MISTSWMEHFGPIEAEEFRPPLDPQDPVEHYCQVRDCLYYDRFESALKAPIGRNFPPTLLLASLIKKESVPPMLEWPGGLLPSVALQCQLALLLALAKETEAALKLAERLAPLVLGGFWTLWTLEKEYDEEETRLSCALFLQAIGQIEAANKLYVSTLPNSPFFTYLYRAAVQIPLNAVIPLVTQKLPETIAWTLQGSKAGVGAMCVGSLKVFAFGPHAHPLNNPSLFGISEAGSQWFCSSAQKDVWFQIETGASHFSLHTLGVSFDKPMAFVFYVGAEECRIQERSFKPKSLQRFVGEASTVHFDEVTIEIDRPLKIELIPLAENQSYWGAGFLLAFWLSPISNKIFFRIQ